MAQYKTQQHRLTARESIFHFVSYDAQPANVRRGDPGMGPTWYLMRAGRRWAVMPQVEGQSEAQVTQGLRRWLEDEGII